jgi:predicted enzyme related to lactoylglutathione lyase
MPERDGYVPGVPCWVDTGHPDPEAVLPFYGGLFGWEFEDVMPTGSGVRYFIARIRGGDVAAVASMPEGAPAAAAWNTYVWVASADATSDRARDAGGSVISAPMDVMDAGRVAVLTDGEGAAFSIVEPRNHKGATVVNEHGALNFNTLATRDPDAARAFYGAVFGWGTLSLPFGLLWALPGYGDHLEERSPGLRGQMAEMGAPEGFIDVVAAYAPIAAHDPATPHWSVTFGVDDAAVTAAQVAELGGEVVSGPTDAPWSRTVVIRDPQGATFVASQFVPENSDLTA